MIKELLPISLQNDENIKALADVFEKGYEEIQKHIINVLIYSRIDKFSEEILDLLAWQFHIEGYELAQSIEEKRRFVKNAIELHRYKGTKYAVRKAIESLGLQAKIKEWFEYGGEPYQFKVYVSSIKNEKSWQELTTLIDEYKNVRSWFDVNYFQGLTERIYFASVVPHGYYAKIFHHLSLSIPPTPVYFASFVPYSYYVKIFHHHLSLSIPPTPVYAGGTTYIAIRMEVKHG